MALVIVQVKIKKLNNFDRAFPTPTHFVRDYLKVILVKLGDESSLSSRAAKGLINYQRVEF